MQQRLKIALAAASYPRHEHVDAHRAVIVERCHHGIVGASAIRRFVEYGISDLRHSLPLGIRDFVESFLANLGDQFSDIAP